MRIETISEPVAALQLKNRIEQLEYIRAMIRELRIMAAGERCEMLTLHLEMAYLEASDQLRELHTEQPPRAEKREKAGGNGKGK